MKITTVLFDLDGTLLDTAPDLAVALNTLLKNHGRAPLPFSKIRPVVSHGAKGLIHLGFNIDDTDSRFALLREELLNIYQQNLCKETQLFDGIESVLNYIDVNSLCWGIITNKPAFLTEPLVDQINFNPKPKCVISGDTLSKCKPDPEPLLHACKLINVIPEECVYIGDAERDIIAGKRAGMQTIIANYGYLSFHDQSDTWKADAIINQSLEILDWLHARNN